MYEHYYYYYSYYLMMKKIEVLKNLQVPKIVRVSAFSYSSSSMNAALLFLGVVNDDES